MTDASSILDLALRILTGRLMVLLALCMTFGLFCWAMWMGTLLSLIVATVFGIFGYLPVLFKEHSRVQAS